MANPHPTAKGAGQETAPPAEERGKGTAGPPGTPPLIFTALTSFEADKRKAGLTWAHGGC